VAERSVAQELRRAAYIAGAAGWKIMLQGPGKVQRGFHAGTPSGQFLACMSDQGVSLEAKKGAIAHIRHNLSPARTMLGFSRGLEAWKAWFSREKLLLTQLTRIRETCAGQAASDQANRRKSTPARELV